VQLDSTAYSASAGPMQPIDQAGLAPGLFDAVNFRRARLRLDGTFGEQYDFAAEYDLANQINAFNQIDPLYPSLGPLPEVTELWLQLRDLPLLGTLRVGNQKDPFGYEHLASCRSLDLMERSFCQDAFVGPFNDGFVPGIQAMNGTADGRLAWQVGEFVNTAAPFGFSDFAGGSLTTGRIVWLPTYADDGRELLHLALAGRSMQPRNGLVRFRSRGALFNGPPGPDNAIYADSGVLSGCWQNMLGTELVANRGPWSFQAEYFGSWLYDAATTDIGPLSTAGFQPPPGTPVGTVFYQGGYVETAWFLTGESRTYSLAEHRFDRPIPRRILALSRSRPRGGGAWQAVARYNYLCLNDGQVEGGVLNGVTLGLNWLLTPYARVVFNYDYTHRDYRSTPWANGPSGPVPVPSYDGSGGIHGFGTRLAFDF
jgi:phosphate-selective porin OprO/OprP